MQHVVDKISQVGRNAIVIAVASLASRLLGLFRDRVLASEFGAGHVLDAYYAAFRLPDFVFNLIILGALSAAFIPVFSELLFKDKKRAWDMVNNFTNIVLSALAFLLIIILIFTPWFVELIAPGFTADQAAITILLTRIMLLSPLFFAVSSIIGGVLNSFGRFFAYSIAPILYNIGIIVGALYFAPHMGPAGLAWGVILGAFLHMIVQLPTFLRVGFRFRPLFNIHDRDFRRVLSLMIPVTISLALVQINLLVDNIIGSTLFEGSISINNFASNLISLPVGLIGLSFAVSVFPLLSYAYSQKREEQFIESFSSTFRFILYLTIPAMVFILLLRAHIVRLVLGAGLFDVADTIWTSRVLGYLAFGLVGQALIPLLVRTYYASNNTKMPLIIALIAIIVNIVCSIVFTKIIDFKVVGLAIGSVAAIFVNLFLLLGLLKGEFPKIPFTQLLTASGRYIFLSVLAGLMIYRALYVVEPYINTLTTVGLFYQTSIAAFVGIATYFFLSAVFKVPEAKRLADSIVAVFKRNDGR